MKQFRNLLFITPLLGTRFLQNDKSFFLRLVAGMGREF